MICLLYHLSQNGYLSTLNPMVPECAVLAYEDCETERVCFCKTIAGCLAALQDSGGDFYVYVPKHDIPIIKPRPEQVIDAKYTGEVWCLEPVDVICIGKIKSDDWYRCCEYNIMFRGKPEVVHRFYYKWRWIKKYI